MTPAEKRREIDRLDDLIRDHELWIESLVSRRDELEFDDITAANPSPVIDLMVALEESIRQARLRRPKG